MPVARQLKNRGMVHSIRRRSGKTIVISKGEGRRPVIVRRQADLTSFADRTPRPTRVLDRTRDRRYKYIRINIVPIKPNPP
jgi:hypothetical protein